MENKTININIEKTELFGIAQFFIHIISCSLLLLIGTISNSLILIALYKRNFQTNKIPTKNSNMRNTRRLQSFMNPTKEALNTMLETRPIQKIVNFSKTFKDLTKQFINDSNSSNTSTFLNNPSTLGITLKLNDSLQSPTHSIIQPLQANSHRNSHSSNPSSIGSGSSHDIYLANLALADLVSLIFMQPMVIINNYIEWPFGEFTCKFIFGSGNAVSSVSVVTFCAITIERHLAIVHPIYVHNTSKKSLTKRAQLIVVLSWILSYFLTSFPLSFILNVKSSPWSNSSCQISWPNKHIQIAYHLIVFLGLFLIPTCMCLICLLRIWRQMSRSRRFYKASYSESCKNNLNFKNRTQKRRRLEIILIGLLACFLICMTPIQVFLLVVCFFEKSIKQNYLVTRFVYQISYQLLFANGTINPILLIAMSQDIRITIKAILNKLTGMTSSTNH